MRMIRADVSTVCMGLSASMGTILLAGGTKGKRFSLPHSTIHMHPAGIGQMSGNAPDVEIHARELLREQQLTRELLAHDTGQPLERVAKDFDRDLFMTPRQAREYGIIDQILSSEEHDRHSSAL
jgi:ATP-dependent Clp protease protease subunit